MAQACRCIFDFALLNIHRRLAAVASLSLHLEGEKRPAKAEQDRFSSDRGVVERARLVDHGFPSAIVPYAPVRMYDSHPLGLPQVPARGRW